MVPLAADATNGLLSGEMWEDPPVPHLSPEYWEDPGAEGCVFALKRVLNYLGSASNLSEI